MKTKYVILLSLASLSLNSFSQDKDTLGFIGRFQHNNMSRIEAGKLAITPLVGPSYTPEMSLTLSGGMMISFLTHKDDAHIQRSSVPVTLGISVTGAYYFSSKISSYWFQDKLRVFADIWLKNMPDHYWGVGYEEAYSTPKSDSTTAYNRSWWMFNPRFLWQFSKNYFAGFAFDANMTEASDPNPKMMEDEYYQQYGPENMNVGLGLILRYDSRDVPVNAWSGMYVDLSASVYSKALGSDNDYTIYLIDFRKYQNIGREGNTLAFQAKTRLSYGDVPYGELSQLGTPFDLRGYTWGRYRDKMMLFFLGEYRYTFLDSSGSLSNHGAVAWIGTGSIAEEFTAFESWLPNFGLGYRLQVQPRMNVRIDIGIGRETSGIYFNLNEAF